MNLRFKYKIKHILAYMPDESTVIIENTSGSTVCIGGLKKIEFKSVPDAENPTEVCKMLNVSLGPALITKGRINWRYQFDHLKCIESDHDDWNGLYNTQVTAKMRYMHVEIIRHRDGILKIMVPGTYMLFFTRVRYSMPANYCD